jgi:hypothetical protein
MINTIRFAYAVCIICQVSGYDLCGYRCICNFLEPGILLAECSSGMLSQLPFFSSELITISVNYINLNDNVIENLDAEIISNWISLLGIDLRANPLNCSQLGLFKDEVTVLSDCRDNFSTTGEYD